MMITRVRGLALQSLETHAPFPMWTGPILRGFAQDAFKRFVCRHPDFAPSEHAKEMPDCSTCELRRSCQFPMVFRPGLVTRGSPPPSVILIPEFSTDGYQEDKDRHGRWVPVKGKLPTGTCLNFEILMLGASHQILDMLLCALAAAGPLRGLDVLTGRVRVKLIRNALRSPERFRLSPSVFGTVNPTETGVIPRLKIKMSTPLRIVKSVYSKAAGTGKSRKKVLFNPNPGISDIVRAAVRCVIRQLELSGDATYADESLLVESATLVSEESASWKHFVQNRKRECGRSSELCEWISGDITVTDFPAGLLPWLIWGGRLLVADSRSDGSGAFRVEIVE